MKATPRKLHGGGWGACVQNSDGAVSVGDPITVSTKGGKTWDTVVSKVVWRNDEITIVATESNKSPKNRRSSKECAACGHIEQRNSRGYVDGDWVNNGECQSCREERLMGY